MPTPQNGQTHSNNSSAKANELFECDHFEGNLANQEMIGKDKTRTNKTKFRFNFTNKTIVKLSWFASDAKHVRKFVS